MDNFDLKKYLVENKVTTQSKLNENMFTYVLLDKGEEIVNIEALDVDEANKKVLVMYPENDPMLTHINGKEINWNK
jgi:hypothetical protein